PVRPLRAARLPHDDRARVHGRRLAASLGDAIVADHRCGEAHDLLRERGIGDDLLVAGNRSREHGFAERKPMRGNRIPAKDGAVLEHEEARHDEYTSRPAAIVARTRPFTVAPSSHELTDRERKTSSVIWYAAPRSTRTMFAAAPTAT